MGAEVLEVARAGSGARRLAHGLWLATIVLWATTLVLTLVDRPSEAIVVLLMAVPTATYATVGALVARRRPDNPIGWLFCAVALGLALWLLGGAYAQSGLGGRPVGLGSLPGAAVAAWVGVLSSFMILPVALPTFLLYFPDGHLRSRRWRPAVAAVAFGAALIVFGTVVEISQNSGTIRLVPPTWVARIPWIGGFRAVGLALTVAAGVAGLVALMLRFRSATARDRQPLRLLVVMITAMAAATAIALVAALALGQGADWAWIPFFLAVLLDGFGVLIGIPLAAAAAVLTYGLYDVGVVVKKTVVYVLLVVVFLLLLGFLSLTLNPLVFLGGFDGDGSTERDRLIAMIATGVAVFTIVMVFGFRPAKRLARRLVFGRRATPYEAMAEFSERLGETYSTGDVLPRMAEIVRASTGADAARVWLRVGNELRPAASAPRTAPAEPIPSIGDELPEIPGVRTFPVRDRGELLGALTVEMPAAEPLRKGGEKLVTDLAAQAGLVLRNVRLIEELQESRRRIVTAQDERARKLERDLHDGAQQQLVALSVKIGLIEQLAARDPQKAGEILADLKSDAADALDNLRDLARGIYPPLLADKGLAAALDAQARKSPLDVRIDAAGSGRYPQEVEAAVYFCALEALQNVAKYAGADTATVTLSETNGDLSFRVRDDGAGFDLVGASAGSGLTNMRDRLEALGGSLVIMSSPGTGTTVAGSVPLKETR